MLIQIFILITVKKIVANIMLKQFYPLICFQSFELGFQRAKVWGPFVIQPSLLKIGNLLHKIDTTVLPCKNRIYATISNSKSQRE